MGTRAWLPLGLLSLSIWGCVGLRVPLSQPTKALFLPPPQHTAQLALLTQDLDSREPHCREEATCEEIHFTRALANLFQNREAARALFRRVIDESPASPLADSSRLWLRVIDLLPPSVDSEEQPNPLTDVTAQLVYDWIDRHLAQQTKPDPVATFQVSSTEQSHIVQALQKQLRERDRRIAGLRAQLEALKQIDQDNEERKKTLKRPATFLPLPEAYR